MSLYSSAPVTFTRVLTGAAIFAGCTYAGRQLLISQAELSPDVALKSAAILTTILLGPLIVVVTAKLQRRPSHWGHLGSFSPGWRD